jgi:polysaccharide export outer membrane protein
MRTLIRSSLSLLIALSVCALQNSGLAQQAKSQDDEARAKEYYQMGNFYYQQARYKEAEEQYQKAMELLKDRVTASAVLPGAAMADVPNSAGAPAGKAVSEYIIGIEDVLGISVWQNPDLTQEVVVRPDGRISFPLVGDIDAQGLTLVQMDTILTERLKEFLRMPEVSISLKKLGGKKILILGEVRSPGVYSLQGKSVLEAIGLAGGFTNHAVASSVVVISGGFDRPQAQRINLNLALKRGDVKQNIALQTEDIVFVPKKFIADLNYFLTQVITPISQGVYSGKAIGDW